MEWIEDQTEWKVEHVDRWTLCIKFVGISNIQLDEQVSVGYKQSRHDQQPKVNLF